MEGWSCIRPYPATWGSVRCGLRTMGACGRRSVGRHGSSFRSLRAAGRLGDPEGLFVVVATLVEGGEPLVGMAADELFGDARLVQADGHFEVPVLQRLLGLRVAFHSGLEAAQRVFLRPDPIPLVCIQAEETRGFSRRPGGAPAEDVSK